MSQLRILVADDHEIVRRGTVSLLEGEPGWEVVGEATDGQDAVEKVRQLKPDIVVLDVGMPALNGLEAARQILREVPDTKILVLTVHESEQVVREVLDAGARGFLLKTDAARDLVAAIDALRKNKTFFTSKVAELVLDGYLKTGPDALRGALSKGRLTPREREVLQLLAKGNTTKEVAALLGLGFKTADTHRTNIMRKLSLRSFSELVLYAVKNGIVQVTAPLPKDEIPGCA